MIILEAFPFIIIYVNAIGVCSVLFLDGKNEGENKKAYSLEYDNLNRLESADYIEIDDNNQIVTASQGDYRYAYQGQEKDPETGWEAFELRMYDGRVGRWMTMDPYNQFHSPYLAMGNDPIKMIDPDGGTAFDHLFDYTG